MKKENHRSYFSYLYPILPLSLILLLLITTSCAPRDTGGAQPDYKETKQMVLDILKTEEGKKAIQEVLSDEQIKNQMILDEPTIKSAIETTLLSDENKQKWQEMMNDPEFAKKHAQHIEEENKRLIKDLMKDPEYRTSMMELLKEPEMEEQFLQIAKSNPFRQQTMSVMKEAIESPYFRLELLQLLSKVAENPPDQSGQGKEGEGGQGGESGGSGGS